MPIDRDALKDEFVEYVEDHGYAPEPWCSEEQMSAEDWITDNFSQCEGELFDPDEYVSQEDLDPEDPDASDPEYEEKHRSHDGRPAWWKELKLVQEGYDNSIDNCVGEFWNYHLAIGDFMHNKLQCNVKLQKEAWFDQSDQIFTKDQHIRYIANGKEVSFTRLASTNARKNEAKNLGVFLDTVYQKFAKACKN